MRLGEPRLEPDGLEVFDHRLIELAVALQDPADAVVGYRQARFEPDCLAVLAHRFIELARAHQRLAEVLMRERIVGIEPDRFAERGAGLVLIGARDGRGRSEVAMGCGVIRIEPDRRAVCRQRLLMTAQFPEAVSDIEVDHGVVPLNSDELPVD